MRPVLRFNLHHPPATALGPSRFEHDEEAVAGSNEEPVTGSNEEAGPSTLRDILAVERKRRAEDRRRVDRLQPEARRQLTQVRTEKERGLFLMTDALPKRSRKPSPDRVECPLKEGTPSMPPPRVPRPWEVLNSTEPAPTPPSQSPTTPPPSLPPPSPIPTLPPSTPSCYHRAIPSFSPSTGIQSVSFGEASSLNMMDVDVDLYGFSPSSAAAAFIPPRPQSPLASLSAHPVSPHLCDDNVDSWVDRAEGSDLDEDDNIVEPLERIIYEESERVLELDAAEDIAIRELSAMHDADITSFNWVKDASTFTGRKEIFEGPSGPTFPVNGETPLTILQKIWDVDVMQIIVNQTNIYARRMLEQNSNVKSRIVRWHDTDVDEMWVYFAILMVQSLAPLPVEKEYWYPASEAMRMAHFSKIMSFPRFILIKKCLHFADNSQIIGTSNEDKRLAKIWPLIEIMRSRFSSLFMPGQEIALDESLLLWKGRLSFAQLIATKRARVGIKSYELCDSKTGYLWDFRIYTGKGNVTEPANEPQNDPTSATSKIVFDLICPLLGRGHVLVMDNFYNTPLLSRLLKQQKTDTMGTLRLNREFVPDSLKISKSQMPQGEVAFSQTTDMTIVVWQDVNLVSMISTFHDVKVAGKEKHGRFFYKPQVVLDYNQSMGGVDKKDQLLSAFPMERTRNLVWYKKLFRRLLNISVMNAWIIFCADNTTMPARRFRQNLVNDILARHKGGWAPSSSVVLQTPNVKRLVEGGHYPKKSKTKGHRCKWCSMHGRASRTVWLCDVCDVSLCIEHCFKDFHTKAH